MLLNVLVVDGIVQRAMGYSQKGDEIERSTEYELEMDITLIDYLV